MYFLIIKFFIIICKKKVFVFMLLVLNNYSYLAVYEVSKFL